MGAQPVNGAGYLQIYSNAALTSILGLIKPTGKLASLGGYLKVLQQPPYSAAARAML